MQTHHIIGIVCMLAAAACISLSPSGKSSGQTIENLLPIYIPVIISFSMPLICSTFGMFSKYALGTKRISPFDFSFGYFMVGKGFFFLASLIYFQIEPINWRLYVIGFFGSIIDCLGCFLANCAVATGSPVGPIFALCDT